MKDTSGEGSHEADGGEDRAPTEVWSLVSAFPLLHFYLSRQGPRLVFKGADDRLDVYDASTGALKGLLPGPAQW
jgi:hypothetical protein